LAWKPADSGVTVLVDQDVSDGDIMEDMVTSYKVLSRAEIEIATPTARNDTEFELFEKILIYGGLEWNIILMPFLFSTSIISVLLTSKPTSSRIFIEALCIL
jgi:hypothetical protein